MDTDVLIVGAGSAGSVLAERISADPDCRVTLLEAGPAMTPELRALTGRAAVLPIGPDSPVARRYRTELTRSPAIARDIVRGACVGGSGAANGGYFCRALPGDFDEAGVPGWSWADVEPHYRAIETDLDFPDPRGGGPIPVRRVAVMTGPTAQFATAANAAGLRWLPNLDAVPTGDNAPPGIGAVPCNIVDGTRIGPGVAFLEPVRNRPNLTVLTATRATRVLTTGGRTTGIEAVGPGGPVTVSADRVVLCAGAIESAHLLMLSGIGPAEDLGAVGIPVIADLAVGRRSWDHPEWLMSTTWDPAPDAAVLQVVLVTGELEIRPYTKGFAAMGGAAESPADRPHIGVALMRPRAHGRLTVTSADPRVAPRIEHRYDSETGDIEDLRRGCELVSGIVGGTTELGAPTWSTSQHLCGTAPMGAAEGSVVDARCRVHGVAGLWVADGSVLPRIPSRGPHATIAMIGHRVAEFVTSG